MEIENMEWKYRKDIPWNQPVFGLSETKPFVWKPWNKLSNHKLAGFWYLALFTSHVSIKLDILLKKVEDFDFHFWHQRRSQQRNFDVFK